MLTAVRQAIRWDDDDREILRLVQVEHLTLIEAADRMGRSYEATKKLYARALARLRALLEAG